MGASPTGDPLHPSTDEQYEKDRELAEKDYFIASTNWFVQVVAEVKELPPPVSAEAVVFRAFQAGLRGDVALPSEARSFPAPIRILELSNMCRDFAKAELRAYVSLVQRSRLPKTQKVGALRLHTEETIAETLAHRWGWGMKQFEGLYTILNSSTEAWKEVEEEIRGAALDFEREIWFDLALNGAKTNDSVKVKAIAQLDRADLLTEYKRRARAYGITVTDKMIAQAASRRWNDRTPVGWWKRHDSRSGAAQDKLIRAVLEKDPRALWGEPK